jgi:GT2 family glycosyltransferase
MSDRLSVCIVAYHNYDDIENAIRTMEKYTSSSISKKVYVVDNGNTPDVEKENKEFVHFLKNYPNVIYVDAKKNLGFGGGHNKVIQYLDSEYHCIMNPDILFFEDAFKPILQYMDHDKKIGMVIPNIVDEQNHRQLVYRKELTVFDMFIRMFAKRMFPKRIASHTLQDMDYSKPFQVPFGQGSFLVIRTDLFKRIDGFDDHFFMRFQNSCITRELQ